MTATGLPLSQRLFLALGRAASRIPPIRGKTRLLLVFYKLLGLTGRHVFVQARLRRPIPYLAGLDLHSWLQRVAFLTGGYEEDTVAFLLKLHRLTRGGGYLLDVGANIGLISIPFALSIRDEPAAAIAVEAVSANVDALVRNIRMNHLDREVRVIPSGVGDVSGTVEIQVEGDLREGEGTGTANIMPAGSTFECVRQTLRISTLDELAGAGSLPRGCAVIKIDTDGYDLKVLQGGVQFLERERPVIYGEFAAHCLNWHGQSLADVVAFAGRHGYEALVRIPGTWTFQVPVGDAGFVQDLLLVPRERADDYRVCMAPAARGR